MTQKEFQNAAEAIIAARPGVTDKQIYNALGTDAATATPQNQRKMREGLLASRKLGRVRRDESGGYHIVTQQ